jgi:hypothetical protein
MSRKRSKQAACSQAIEYGTSHNLRPGQYLYWQRRIYRIIALHYESALQILTQTIPEAEHVPISLLDLFAQPTPDTETVLVASSLEALTKQIEERYASEAKLGAVLASDLPENFVVRAHLIMHIVETVRCLVSQEEQRAQAQGEPFSQTQALRRALAICHGSRIHVPVNGTHQEHIIHVGLTTYYKYERLYTLYQGDTALIATSFHRSSFRHSHLSRAQFHFVDTCLLLYYGNARVTKTRVYRLAVDILDTRTQGWWVDPDRCGADIPEDLVTELLDLKLPLQAILDNPEKAALLVKIEMPSPAWFYGYANYLEASPDQGKAIITKRLGKDMWDQYYLIFDTFVKRAQLPLQYVFADHWLVDAWIVDEQTRSQTSRLWLTLLLDAYSRAIVGMALLSEGPCIESIQTALQHAIWPKTSHTACGVAGEWSTYGIPQQLFLDNAWAHHSHSLENLARTIALGGRYNSIDLVFRPPYKGRYGAIIERLFKNFSGQLQELVKGAIFGPTAKHARESAKEACLLYTDLDRILHQLVVIYQHTPHRELQGRTPHQVWSEGIASSGLPMIPPLSAGLERSFMRLYPDVRSITSRGIAAFGLHYWSVELGGLARRERTGKAIDYQFRYTPADISRIALFHDGVWVGDAQARELQQADGSVRQVSQAEWTQAKQRVRDHNQQAMGKTAGELVRMTDLKEIHERRSLEKKATRRARPESKEATQSPAPETTLAPASLDEETTRVLRFLHSRGENQ